MDAADRDSRDATEHDATATRQHWDEVYERVPATAESWFQDEPAASLELVTSCAASPTAAIIDVGGGASRFAGRLVDRGFCDITVLDVSRLALERARRELGPRAGAVQWLATDVLAWRPSRRFDVWHDRAVFHFLVDAGDRGRYVETVREAVAPAGHLVIGTFAADGPESCSGLPIARYDADALAGVFAPGFELVTSRREDHLTPTGGVQHFTWVVLRRTA